MTVYIADKVFSAAGAGWPSSQMGRSRVRQEVIQPSRAEEGHERDVSVPWGTPQCRQASRSAHPAIFGQLGADGTLSRGKNGSPAAQLDTSAIVFRIHR